MCGETAPSPSAYMANLRQPMPLDRKVRLLARNTARKVIRLKSCCGHPGEPGC
jgi:hypothetical protein